MTEEEKIFESVSEEDELLENEKCFSRPTVKIDKSFAYELYVDILNKERCLPFNFDKNKQKNLVELCKRILNNNYTSYDQFVRAILKSYLMENSNKISDDIRPFIEAKDFTVVNNKEALVNKFLYEKCLDKPKSNKKKSEDLELSCIDNLGIFLAKVVASELNSIFGNVLYIEKNKPGENVFKDALLKNLKEQGYKKVADKFYVLDKQTLPTIRQENQDLLLETYIVLIKRYIADPNKFYDYSISAQEHAEFWKVIETAVENIDNRLVYSKNAAEYKLANSMYKFYSKEKDRYVKTCDGPDEFNILLENAINAVRKGKATKKDLRVLDEFCERIAQTNKVLAVRDEKGCAYPVNYFVYMPVPLGSIKKCLLKLHYCGYLSDKPQQKKELAKLEQNLSRPAGIFSDLWINFPGGIVRVETILSEFKDRKITKMDGTVLCDNTSEEKYSDFKQKVFDTMEKYNLPRSQVCYRMVCEEILRNREPVKLNNEKSNEMGK